jgi:ADP-ribose pyrophosphatase YjhB (NUDIX family)
MSVIAVIPMHEGVVMVRRAIDPGYGLWVVPGGFVDLGEPVEARWCGGQEAQLTVRPIRLLNIYSYRDHRTVVAAYVTEYVSGELTAGDETLEARVFGLKEIPWPRIAFSTTKEALREYISRFGP